MKSNKKWTMHATSRAKKYKFFVVIFSFKYKVKQINVNKNATHDMSRGNKHMNELKFKLKNEELSVK